MKVAKYEDLFTPANTKVLVGRLIRNYIKTCRWFGGKARLIREISIAEAVHFSYNQEEFSWLIIEVKYIEGLPELYQLPLGFASRESESLLREGMTQAIIAPVTISDARRASYMMPFTAVFSGKPCLYT
jgi:maltose alpha-D-glucosyltransferase / alpha-amylase